MTSIPILNVRGAEVSEVVKLADLAILPFGSVEYHGPHAPLGTDSFIAAKLAERTSARLNTILCPLIAYTTCPVTTRGNPGTISIDAEVMAAYIEAIFRGLFLHGVKGLLAINAHDGNIDTIRRAVDRLGFDFPDRSILLINWWQTLPTSLVESLGLFSQGGGHGHGGPLETSAAWAVQPDSVDLSKAPDIDVASGGGEMMSVLSHGGPRPHWEGYHGRISESSIKKGQILLKLAEDRIVDLVQNWILER
jgi:creatinine amidohydrolase